MEKMKDFFAILGGLYVILSVFANILPHGHPVQLFCAKIALALKPYQQPKKEK